MTAIEELLARSAFYHGLSMVLRHPDSETMKWLAMQEHHRWLEIVTALTQEGGRQIGEPRRQAGSPLVTATQRLVVALDGASIADWTKEHERIFGHSVQSAAPPYELEYGEEHSHRQPQELGDIAAFYQAFGLQVSAAARERVDHLVTECEFMQVLLYKQACALDQGEGEHVEICADALRRFLSDHLGRWGPAFALRLVRTTHWKLLQTAAQVTLEWFILECTRMQVPLGPCELPLRQPKEQDDPTTCPRPEGPMSAKGGPERWWGDIGCAACEFKQSENMGGGDGDPV